MEEETGNGWTEGLHADDRDLCLETYLKSFSARQRFRMQYRMMSADGELFVLENGGSPVFNESGDFTGFIGSAADAGNRSQAYFTPDDESVRMVFSLTERDRSWC